MIPAVTAVVEDAALEAAIKIAQFHNLKSGAAENPAIPGVNGVDLAAKIRRHEAVILGQPVTVWAEEPELVELLAGQAMAYQEQDPDGALADAIRWATRNHCILVEEVA